MLRELGIVREVFDSDVPGVNCRVVLVPMRYTSAESGQTIYDSFLPFSHACCRLTYSWRNQLAAKIIFRKPEMFGGGVAKFAGALSGVPCSYQCGFLFAI